jgi:hypothetical protein
MLNLFKSVLYNVAIFAGRSVSINTKAAIGVDGVTQTCIGIEFITASNIVNMPLLAPLRPE